MVQGTRRLGTMGETFTNLLITRCRRLEALRLVYERIYATQLQINSTTVATIVWWIKIAPENIQRIDTRS